MEAIFGLFSLFFMLIWALMFLMMFGGLALWIWMLVDAISRDDADFPSPGPNTKLMWILILVFASWIGAAVYYFVVKRPSK